MPPMAFLCSQAMVAKTIMAFFVKEGGKSDYYNEKECNGEAN
jgi:hypothetical protein